MTLGST